DDPTTCPKSDIQHTMKDSWVSLLCQDTAHPCRGHLILDGQTSKFFLVLSILNKICTGIIIDTWIKWGRHDIMLLLLAVCLISHPHRATLPLAHPLLQVRVTHLLAIIQE